MNIKDIANIAGVSTATVSKVLNNKANDISEKTRKKVLEVVSEYQYVPFSKVRQHMDLRSHLIGVIHVGCDKETFEIIKGIEDKASEAGYSVLVCNARGDIEKQFTILLGRNVEGILLIGVGHMSLEETVTPVISVNADPKERIRNDIFYLYCDIKKSAEKATEYLIERGHSEIGCLLQTDDQEAELGYRDAMRQHRLPIKDAHIFMETTAELTGQIGVNHICEMQLTALLCGNVEIACCVSRLLRESGRVIPHDVSVMVLRDASLAEYLEGGITAMVQPSFEIGKMAVEQLKEILDGSAATSGHKEVPAVLKERDSVMEPAAEHPKEKIIVVGGGINADITISIPSIPSSGDVVIANGMEAMPGGKGANQAVSIGKLGGLVYMIGRVGNDSEGRLLYQKLRESHVKTDGVVIDDTIPTGKAYINAAENGESSIVVYLGANSHLGRNHIHRFRHLFENAGYCLLSLGMPLDALHYTLDLCSEMGIQTILKPSGSQKLKEDDYEKISYIIPNEKELSLLIQGEGTVEEKAEQLLKLGVKNVIVTLGEKGCYFRDEECFCYFPSADFKVVDTTGASDAFAGAFTVSLSEGKDRFYAIGFATFAAGLCITQKGVQPALPDSSMMQVYQEEIDQWSARYRQSLTVGKK